jgi:hypothetical protein
MIQWYPAYQSCQRFFVNNAQYSGLVQCLAAFMNIRLPYQDLVHPLYEIPDQPHPSHLPRPQRHLPQIPPPPPFISLFPYIRRLIVTRFDQEGIMKGFFGEDWLVGIGPLQEMERRNYLFAAKSVGWAQARAQYDIAPDQMAPYVMPLANLRVAEVERAEREWSDWLAFEDWMINPDSR